MAIPKRILGKTGIEVSALGLGGVCWNLLDEDKDAVAVVLRAIDRGITYLDTASSYKQSERRLGLALMERDRSKLFVTTKCIKRSGDEVKREIEESFERLQLETIDLMQLHAIDEEENLDEVLGNDGALRVIEEYQAAGKIRFVGLTGHTAPAQFERMLGEYDFDTVLNPAGPVNRVWNDFIGTSMAAARRLGMGVVAMKVMAYGQVPPEDRPDYLRYTMGQDVDVAIVGMDTVEQVEENVRVAEAFAPLETQQERALLERALALVPEARKDLWWLSQERIAS
jgi:aryl-alcohol dehydrogenase-like predicted oxidoreductase